MRLLLNVLSVDFVLIVRKRLLCKILIQKWKEMLKKLSRELQKKNFFFEFQQQYSKLQYSMNLYDVQNVKIMDTSDELVSMKSWK